MCISSSIVSAPHTLPTRYDLIKRNENIAAQLFVVVVIAFFLLGLFLFSVFLVAMPHTKPPQGPPPRLLQTMTIIIKSEKSKRLLSLKIAHQNGINIVEQGEEEQKKVEKQQHCAGSMRGCLQLI